MLACTETTDVAVAVERAVEACSHRENGQVGGCACTPRKDSLGGEGMLSFKSKPARLEIVHGVVERGDLG